MKIVRKKEYKNLKAVDFFRAGFFWDCVQDEIMLYDDFDLVIQRVLSRSSNLSKDLNVLDKIYFKNAIKYIALEKSGQIFGVEQIEQIAKHYSLNPKKFRRYFL